MKLGIHQVIENSPVVDNLDANTTVLHAGAYHITLDHDLAREVYTVFFDNADAQEKFQYVKDHLRKYKWFKRYLKDVEEEMGEDLDEYFDRFSSLEEVLKDVCEYYHTIKFDGKPFEQLSGQQKLNYVESRLAEYQWFQEYLENSRMAGDDPKEIYFDRFLTFDEVLIDVCSYLHRRGGN